MSILTNDQICEMIADTRGLALLLKERLEKLENVVSKEEMPKTRELDDIVAKMYKDVEWLKKVEYCAGSQWPTPPNPDPFLGESGKIAFTDCSGKRVVNSGYCPVILDPTASPKNMPFSVALEFLKAGRRVRRFSWPPDMCMWVAGGCITGVHSDDLDGLLESDWMVIEERGRL